MSWRSPPGSSPWRDDEKRRKAIAVPTPQAAIAAALGASYPPSPLPEDLRKLLAKLC